ncbi:3-deoxy-manno-octulosonate cytidylyltransferase [Vibrio owensii]|uniref:3-deoxy-manno-octulosonate cytidylyltransferase n=1 Tax=Vibrio owensii TaxID=696485 RepID=UPI0018F25479|nr:3-deoxy-manno-octulosonate cytidylyltransferase [Vibrio owensii]
MSKIKVVIPARYGSSRLPGKPLLDISGKPMFWHVFQRCLEAGFERTDIVLATDDKRISDMAFSLGMPVVLTANEHESGTDRIFEVVEKKGWGGNDIIVNVQGDEPLVSPALIRQLADFSLERREFQITTAVAPISNKKELHNPNIVKAILGLNDRALYFTRSDAPYNREDNNEFSLSFRHIGIYAYSVRALQEFCSYKPAPLELYEKLEQLRALSNGMSVGAFCFYGNVAHGVDTMEDYLSIKNQMEIS